MWFNAAKIVINGETTRVDEGKVVNLPSQEGLGKSQQEFYIDPSIDKKWSKRNWYKEEEFNEFHFLGGPDD